MYTVFEEMKICVHIKIYIPKYIITLFIIVKYWI